MVHAKCEAVSRPFASDTSPKRIDREGLGKHCTGTRQELNNITVNAPFQRISSLAMYIWEAPQIDLAGRFNMHGHGFCKRSQTLLNVFFFSRAAVSRAAMLLR